MSFISGDELVKKIKDDEERLAKQVSVVDDYIVINVSYEYNIPLSGCATHAQILGWVVHLCEKTWITTEVLERFVKIACGKHGLDYRL